MKKAPKKTRTAKTPKAKLSSKPAAKKNGKGKTVTLAELNKAIPRLRAAKKTKPNGRPSDKARATGKPTSVERELPVKLTEAELMKLGDQAAEDQRGIEHIKIELKSLSEDKRELEAQRTRKLHDIKAGVEQRLVKCHIEENLDKNVLRVTRDDTGEIIEERALTLAERQGELGFSMGMRAQDERAAGSTESLDELDDEMLEHAYEDEAAL